MTDAELIKKTEGNLALLNEGLDKIIDALFSKGVAVAFTTIQAASNHAEKMTQENGAGVYDIAVNIAGLCSQIKIQEVMLAKAKGTRS